MKRILNFFLPIAVIAGFLLAVHWITNRALYGPYISQVTEEKYLRNLDKFRPISERQLHVSIEHQDTISWAAKTHLFSGWYIDDVGQVPNGSRLARAFDSIATLYVNRKK